MMKEMIPPPLPPKTRGGGNSCSTTMAVVGAGAGATVFVRPNVQVHSTPRDSVTNAYSSSASYTSSSTTTTLNGGGDHHPGGHVVKIKINPENGELKTSSPPIISSVQLLNCHKPPAEDTTSVVRISIGDTHQQQQPEEMRGGATDRTSAYFFCNGGISAVMSSGQCSPSDTLDSGTCSDLDGTPPPLPKKKSVTVTVIGAQHKRASSLTSSGADPDSASGSDNESNISCDSLNSNDLNNHEGLHIPTPPPPLIRQTPSTTNTSSSAFLPQGLLKDIRDRSAKLSQPTINLTEVKETISNTVEIIDPQSIPKSKSPETPISRQSPVLLVSESTYEERQEQQKKSAAAAAVVVHATEKIARVYTYETDKYYKFHLNEHAVDTESDTTTASANKFTEDDESFAGYRDLLGGGADGASTIRSAKGTVRGVKNRVRAGIATFLQINDATTKSYREKDAGKVVVYSTTMGIVRHTYQQCVKVKQILRTHLVKFEERDVFMSTECQQEIRERMRCDSILIPQVFVDGQHIGDAETIERLNESGELRKILKPYKSPDACTTCNACGGYRLLPCPVCNGSKKSVHRNDFTTEFVALKCMNCDEVGLVRCSICS